MAVNNGTPLIQMIKVNKRFGRVQALRDVDFQINRNEIIGLVGDNGAGKSTLINILSGIYPPDGGTILADGKEVHIRSHEDSMALGVETIYQNTALVDQMNISRNFFLNREPTYSMGMLRLKDMDRISMEVLGQTGISGIDSPHKLVGTLSGGQRQAVAIARAEYFKTKIMLLDEPTSALSVKETHRVLDTVVQLKDAGISSVFVTHNIHHVFSVADRFVILNRGIIITECRKEETCAENIIDAIRSV